MNSSLRFASSIGFRLRQTEPLRAYLQSESATKRRGEVGSNAIEPRWWHDKYCNHAFVRVVWELFKWSDAVHLDDSQDWDASDGCVDEHALCIRIASIT